MIFMLFLQYGLKLNIVSIYVLHLNNSRIHNLKVIVSVDQIKKPITGTGRYSYELVSELRRLPQIESLRYFRGASFDLELIDQRNPKSYSGRFARYAMSYQAMINLYRNAKSFRQERALRGYEDHLFHGTSFYLPPFNGHSVVTIHDLSTFFLPECHPPERVRYMETEVGLSIERASLLITVSEFTRMEVAKYFGKRLEDIFAIPLASAPCFFPREGSQINDFLMKYGLCYQRYSLFVGTIEPRKNLLVLLDAYERLSLGLRKQWPLVLTGYKGWKSDEIHEKIAKGMEVGWVKYLGFVDDVELPLLYSGARLFLFPSLYEGFGLPVLEALSSGIPVVCSNASSLPEIAEGVALMCDANDVGALSDLIKRGLEDNVWRAEAVSSGLRKASHYSWQRCAQATVDVYANALRK